MNQNWNSEEYKSNFSFVSKYGSDVLNLLDVPKGSDVMDLGCGNGALASELYQRGYNVIGIEASEEMIEKANHDFPMIPIIHADARNFALALPVDAIFSNAMLHWIDAEDQPQMLRCVYHALKPGGQFVFEMGGYGCTSSIHEALSQAFKDCGYEYTMPFFFPKVGKYATMLESVGFSVKYALLFDRPTELAGDDGLYDWINMFVNIPFKYVIPEDREKITRNAVNSLRDKLYRDGKWYADYVRLRMKAIRA